MHLRSSRFGPWLIPLLYAGIAFTGGLIISPREHYWLPRFVSQMNAAAAMSVYTAIASGMIALTGIVFAFMFVMVQFSATAYCPRLVLWIARDRVMSHS